MIQFKRQNATKNAVKAGLAGVLIGAAGAAVGMAMKDKKNRDLVKKSLSDAKKWTQEKVESAQKGSENPEDPAAREVKKTQSKVEQRSKNE